MSETTDRPPLLLGDDAAMHLLNSRVTPRGEPAEWIGDPVAFERWLEATGFGAFTVGEGVDEAARALREWLRGFVARHAGRPLAAIDAAELAPLNAVLSEARLHHAVVMTEDGPRPSLVDVSDGGRRAALQPLAEAAAALICEADFSRVRRCEGPGCSVWFLDRTKSGQRRWCSMALCGNRAKARTHRARTKVETASCG